MSSIPEPSGAIRADTLDEARRIALAIGSEGLGARLLGGAGIALHAHEPISEPLRRPYGDLDYVVVSRHRTSWRRLLESMGYRADQRFNALHGQRRLIFDDPGRGRQIDTFIDTFQMCHSFDFADRLNTAGPSLAPVDLLLTKMQIVEINEKDLIDVVLLLLDHPLGGDVAETIDKSRISRLVAEDWGLTTTILDNVSHVLAWVDASRLEASLKRLARDRLEELSHLAGSTPKSFRWRARARIGRRVPWYSLPDEVGSRG